MDSTDRIALVMILAVACLLGGLLLGGYRSQNLNHQCRMTAIEAKIPSAEIIQLCK